MYEDDDDILEGDIPAPSNDRMTPHLARVLIEKGAIRRETEIDARYKGVDLSGSKTASGFGTFIVVSAKTIKDEVVFEGLDTRDGQKQTIRCDDVIRIDGMEPLRFANIFGLDEAGEVMKMGRRRGRKPKPKVQQQQA